MHELLTIGLTNAVLATAIAVAGWLLTRFWKNPHIASVVWLAVLLKLVTPPVVELPVPVTAATARADEAPAEPRRIDRSSDIDSPVTAGEMTLLAMSPRAPAQQELRPPVEAERPAPPAIIPEAFTASAASSFLDDEREFTPLAAPASRQLGSSGESPAVETSPLAAIASSWTSLALAVWLAGTLLVGLITFLRAGRFHRMVKKATTVDHEMQRAAVHVASRLGLKTCPAVRAVAASVGPMVWAGSRRPLVIVPRPLWNALSDDERDTLLAHELAHVVRRDHVVRRFEAVVLAVYWWLPTAWLAVRRREAAAETCCDALVLSHYPDRPQAYAEALLTAVTILSTDRTPALASGLGRTSELKERLTMIVHDRVPQRPGRAVRWSLLIVATAVLAVGANLQTEHAAQASDSPPGIETAPAEAKSSDDAVAAVDEILFFHADWAVNAQSMKRHLEKRRQQGDPIRLIDVTEKPELMRSNNIESVPTIVFLKNGKEVDRYVGMADDEKLRELVEKRTGPRGDELPPPTVPTASVAPDAVPLIDQAAPEPVSPNSENQLSAEAARALADSSREILFFHADWAEPSASMRPTVQVLQRGGHRIRFIDVSSEPGPGSDRNVRTLPTFIAVKDGKEVGRLEGVQPEETLREFIAKHTGLRSGTPPMAAGMPGMMMGTNGYGFPGRGGYGEMMMEGYGGMSSSPPLSPATRKNIIDGLIKMLADEQQPADVKAQAMRSLGSLAKGTDDETRIETVLVEAAAKSQDDAAKLGAAEALHRLGSSKGVELMWQILESTDNNTTRWSVVEQLQEASAVPPSSEALRILAQHSIPVGNRGGNRKATELLLRAVQDADGVRRLIKAVETLKDPGEMRSEPDTGGFGEEMMGMASGPAPRSVLLSLLAETRPASDDIAAVLVEGLSNDDAGVREAAAKALGNPVPTEGAYGRGAMPGMISPMGGRARGASGSMPGRAEQTPRVEPNLGAAPTAGHQESSQPAAAAPASTPADDAVRKELLEPLIAAGQDEKASPESRVAALTALVKLSKSEEEKKVAEQAVRNSLEKAKEDNEKRALTLLLNDLTAGKSGLDNLWAELGSGSKEKALELVRLLDVRKAIPPDAESIARLARAVVVELNPRPSSPNEFPPIYYHARDIIYRLNQKPEGVERLIEAIQIAVEPKPQLVERDGTKIEFSLKEVGYPTDTPVRDSLLVWLGTIEPTSPDVAKVLAKALSHEDPAIRTAAATALGNYEVEGKEATVPEPLNPDDGDEAKVERGRAFFNVLDKNKDGLANPDEWSASRRLRPLFEAAGVRLDQDISQEEFLATFLKVED